MSQARIVLLTGEVGSGKTTVAGRVVGLARRQGISSCGVLAPAMLDSCGQKVGIWGVDVISGERRLLARTDRDLKGPVVGPYSFDTGALVWAVDVLERAAQLCESLAAGSDAGSERECRLLIVDEIGKLELWQDAGLAPVLPRLAAGRIERALVLVRVSLLVELEKRLGSVERRIFQVTDQNRRDLPPGILRELLGS